MTNRNNTDRQLEGVEQTQTDISEQVERDHSFSESSHRHNLALEATDTGVWEWNLETDEVVWSETLERQVGIEPGTFEGTFEAFQEYLHPDDAAEVNRAIEEAIQGDGAYNVEFRMIREDGEHIWIRALAEYFSEDGVERLIGTTVDITEQKERDQQLERERDRFQAVFEQSFDAMVIADDDGRYLDANESATTLFGLTEEELLGRSIVEFAPEEFDFDAAWSEFQNSERERGTFPLVRPDGTKRYVEYAATMNIVPGQHLSILRDITERRDRNQELQIRTKELQDIIDTVEGAIWVRNADNEYLYMNQYHRNLFDIAEDVEVAGKQFSDLLPAEVAEQFQQNDQRVYETEEPVEIEETVESDDDPRDFLTRITPLFEGGSVYATCGIATDITEQVDRERQLQRERDRLDEFAGVLSHDLRNPLNVAKGRLELVMEECESDHLEPLDQAHHRMEQLINDMLSLARAGGTIGETDAVELAELADACWRNVETETATIRAETEATIQADESRLEQLLENLLRNAVEHGGNDVMITIGDLPDGFYFEDDGPGIPQDERDSVLDPGYSTSDVGTGFGLSIVRDIADAHGWDVAVTEGHDGGARFEFTGAQTG